MGIVNDCFKVENSNFDISEVSVVLRALLEVF